MIRIISLFILLLFISGCSLQSPQNEWQYKSSSAFGSYTTNFLAGNDVLAQNDLKRATNHAKQSANFTQLAKIYLGVCALDISVGKNTNCEQYQSIKSLVENKELQAYYKLLTNSLKNNDIKNLPEQYQEFAKHINKKDKALDSIDKIKKPTSKFLSYALIRNQLSYELKENVIEQASFYGYKKIALFWLKKLLLETKDINKQKMIKKKIAVMESIKD